MAAGVLTGLGVAAYEGSGVLCVLAAVVSLLPPNQLGVWQPVSEKPEPTNKMAASLGPEFNTRMTTEPLFLLSHQRLAASCFSPKHRVMNKFEPQLIVGHPFRQMDALLSHTNHVGFLNPSK